MPFASNIALMLGVRVVYDEDDSSPTPHTNGINEDAAIMFARDEDRRTSFIVDSGAQPHNLHDLEVFGLERPYTSTTGFIANPQAGRADRSASDLQILL